MVSRGRLSQPSMPTQFNTHLSPRCSCGVHGLACMHVTIMRRGWWRWKNEKQQHMLAKRKVREKKKIKTWGRQTSIRARVLAKERDAFFIQYRMQLRFFSSFHILHGLAWLCIQRRTSRPTLSKFLSFKFCLAILLNYKKRAELLILTLSNSERTGRVLLHSSFATHLIIKAIILKHHKRSLLYPTI